MHLCTSWGIISALGDARVNPATDVRGGPHSKLYSYLLPGTTLLILRYLSRALLQGWLASSCVLLLIVVSARFIKYLQQAAVGELKTSFLLWILLYRLPGFLEMILPLGLLLSVLFVYGRLYANSEMLVLESCGTSQGRLLRWTLAPSAVVLLTVALMSLVLAPWGAGRLEQLLATQASMTTFDSNLSPGRFQPIGQGRVLYTEALTQNHSHMQEVFVAAHPPASKTIVNGQAGAPAVTLLRAQGGRVSTDPETGARYLVFSDGWRFDVTPGEKVSRLTKYASYAVRIPDLAVEAPPQSSTLSSLALAASSLPENQAELQWRLSPPLMVVVVLFMALPLARVNPRQGRMMKRTAALLLYPVYLALLISGRSALEAGRFPTWPGLWGVHALFGSFALVLFFFPGIQRQWQRWCAPGSHTVRTV